MRKIYRGLVGAVVAGTAAVGTSEGVAVAAPGPSLTSATNFIRDALIIGPFRV
jgi:hypothetical protein